MNSVTPIPALPRHPSQTIIGAAPDSSSKDPRAEAGGSVQPTLSNMLAHVG